VSGWALALVAALGNSGQGDSRPALRGPVETVISPPLRSTGAGRVSIGPGDLRLPGGRTPHDFLTTDAVGVRGPVERFQTVRPDARIEVPGRGIDILLELDDRLPEGRGAAKLERYDHLLAGWSASTARYGSRGAARPVVVFLCASRTRARACARAADRVLTASRAYAGEYPHDWEYPGRAGILFASERDAHEGVLLAYGLPRLPPEVRVARAQGDPRAREPLLEVREILPPLAR
jgi:hypothetical protein